MAQSRSENEPSLAAAAAELSASLKAANLRIVFVESCTGGRVAGALCGIPGISQHLCGSLVVYRNASKAGWLGVPLELLDDPARGAVSPDASRELAVRGLQATPEADLCVAVTGDLGPGASEHLDGKVFVAGQIAGGDRTEELIKLPLQYSADTDAGEIRLARLESATLAVLRFATRLIEHESQQANPFLG